MRRETAAGHKRGHDMKQPASAMLSIALSLALVTSMCPATALATGGANVQAATNAATAETPAADATNSSKSTVDNRPGSAADEPAAKSYENAIAPTATTAAYAHTETAKQNGVTLTVGWNDAAAGEPTTFHLSATGGSGAYKFRMDAPFYMNPGEGYFGEMVADTSRGQWMTWTSSGTGCDYEFTMTASGRYYHRFYLQDAQSSVWSLRVAAETEISDPAHPSVDQIITNAVAQCRQETSGSEYDMALWLHDWTLDQLEYDHDLNWCSAESGLTRHRGTCESYQRIYAKLLNAAGIANGRIEGNGHTWNAVKIDGKWCQMDLTWDDSNDNWYGDLDQRHLYFGLTDELMAIAHSDHTANYKAEGYAYRSTDLSNNYFVRNGKADEWASAYAERIQQHLDTKDTSFSVDADNGTFPPSISGIQNAIVAYAMNQKAWRTGDETVKLTATSNVTTVSSYQWSVKFDFEVEYPEMPIAPEPPAPSVPDGTYTITSSLDSGMALDIAGGSVDPSANVRIWGSNGTPAQQFKIAYDAESQAYEVVCAKSGLALDVQGGTIANCWNVQQYTRNGTEAQRWLIVPNGDGSYTIACAGNDSYALDVTGSSPAWGTNVQIYERNGTKAQSWKLAAIAPAPSVPDGTYTITSSLDSGMALDIAGGSVDPSANVRIWGSNGTPAQQFKIAYDAESQAYEVVCAKSGLALDVQGGTIANCWNVQQYTRNGTEAQRWLIVPNGDGSYTIACAGNDSYALDVTGSSPAWGTNVQIYERNGTKAQSWKLAPYSGMDNVS